MFHEVGSDEQNARGPMETVSDFGMKSLLSSEERRCCRPDKVDRTHAVVSSSPTAVNIECVETVGWLSVL